MKTHRNLPFFVPFAGCTHRCVFCQQEIITGQRCDLPIEEELAAFDRLMEECPSCADTETQIAFFGGSFTNIPRARMLALLQRASEWIMRGKASSIRISTRPDCIDEEVLHILHSYGVTDVELGVQSMDNAVLAASGRGHTAEDTVNAAALLQKHGFRFGGQMMIGLPCATPASECETAQTICRLGAVEARIYPTVVFSDTALYWMTLSGAYTPLTDGEAAERAAACLRIFNEYGVHVLKIGLHSTDSVRNAPFGPRDGSIGELAAGILLTDRMLASAQNFAGCDLVLHVSPCDLSKLTGHGGYGKQRLLSRLSLASLRILPDGSLPAGMYRFEINSTQKGTTPCD